MANGCLGSRTHCELSERTAHRYMQLAANKPKIDEALKGKSATMATLSLNKALRVIETNLIPAVALGASTPRRRRH